MPVEISIFMINFTKNSEKTEKAIDLLKKIVYNSICETSIFCIVVSKNVNVSVEKDAPE